jgi:RNA polymerase sigma factor (sigma-70 family)
MILALARKAVGRHLPFLDTDDAEDAAQAAAVRALEALPSYTGAGHRCGFLRWTIRNAVIDLGRRRDARQRVQPRAAGDHIANIPAAPASPDPSAAMIEAAVGMLTPRQAQVVKARMDHPDATHAHLADMLSLKADAVTDALSRGYRRLAGFLASGGEVQPAFAS